MTSTKKIIRIRYLVPGSLERQGSGTPWPRLSSPDGSRSAVRRGVVPKEKYGGTIRISRCTNQYCVPGIPARFIDLLKPLGAGYPGWRPGLDDPCRSGPDRRCKRKAENPRSVTRILQAGHAGEGDDLAGARQDCGNKITVTMIHIFRKHYPPPQSTKKQIGILSPEFVTP